jgi:hypothetical protein
MGGCHSANGLTKDDLNEKNLILSTQEVVLIRNSWKIVSKDDGLVKYGTNMMIK